LDTDSRRRCLVKRGRRKKRFNNYQFIKDTIAEARAEATKQDIYLSSKFYPTINHIYGENMDDIKEKWDGNS
jgi:hypothetical protein